ncbi:class I SAM-dependent methyltransferase [Nostoc sp. FACHB-152]|uniref:class I SAM-dependent methyltransferase n=1 Tax=unclassified Nostoc TaxID=2593658 RepID=UPI001682F632|nr:MULTISPECIES: class I SAM-dependent methyltransferase [unclassified Nostoc]MBD2447597.1 class I SAM-dependent methyltransferase [Nostoc sp. FACHB-152]MBD2469369.1 class I SAM-dependent methyltransferase [Nostoc sp. FACHB-145]
MTNPTSDLKEKIRQQFEATPYPNNSLEESPKNKLNLLYVYNFVTPFYLRNQELINTKDKLILDAGCGSGYTSLALAEANPDAKIIGVDLSAESVKLARQRLQYHGFDNAEFYTLSIEDLSQLGMQFDYINCDETLYLLPEPVLGLQAMKSVLQPHGIIHTNLHSYRQRFFYYQAQELFQLMGFLDDAPQQFEAELVRETMRALRDDVVLKQKVWDDTFEQSPSLALINHLLQGDKGYTVKQMFTMLQAADLEFISMVEWRHWELIDLFKNRDDLPAFLAMSLPELSIEEQLHIFELLHPAHRLLDFWCGHPNQANLPERVAEWTLRDWQSTKVHLHPQLRTEQIKQDLINCIAQGRLWSVGNYINLPLKGPVELDPTLAACLLPLWEGEQPFDSLVQRWLVIKPINIVTLKPTSYEQACYQIQSLLSKLEVFLYVLLERGVYNS